LGFSSVEFSSFLSFSLDKFSSLLSYSSGIPLNNSRSSNFWGVDFFFSSSSFLSSSSLFSFWIYPSVLGGSSVVSLSSSFDFSFFFGGSIDLSIGYSLSEIGPGLFVLSVFLLPSLVNFSSSLIASAIFLSAADIPFFEALAPCLIASSSSNSFPSLSRYSSLSESTTLPYLSFNLSLMSRPSIFEEIIPSLIAPVLSLIKWFHQSFVERLSRSGLL